MTRYIYILILIMLFAKIQLYAQYQHFIVKPTPFSSNTNDEFSPVFYKGGIVFCSNRRDNSLVSYKDEQSRLFNIFYTLKNDSTGWKQPRILAKELTTSFNDGPVTFHEMGNEIYFSRNNTIESLLRNTSEPSNKLGIYSAEFINGIWTDIKPFAFNNPLYSFSTPALTPDGERIYFSSDMPGGYGGMDLYYCDRRNTMWDQPVNLGPVINTPENESFPFACKSGKLFFASDGHEGFGGKDVFYTREINTEWIDPVHLDSAINSTADDFGLVTDSTFESGYFSTNRRKTDDIFSFRSAEIKFASCDSLKEDVYCFTFYDEQHQLIDTIPVTYLWDFGDGVIRTGPEVKHCFAGPGEYFVKLNIIDELTGNAIAEQVDYKVELADIQQATINSYNVGIVNEPISFNGEKPSLNGSRRTDYLWNFGDGFEPGGPTMTKTFKRKGEYTVQLGLLTEKDSLGNVMKTCVMKKIRIYDTFQELVLHAEGEEVGIMLYLMDDLSELQQVKIKEGFSESGKSVIKFDKYGINPASYQFLVKVVGVLKENPEVRLEMVIHSREEDISGSKKEISEKWARELAFYFKNNYTERKAFRSSGLGLSHPLFRTHVQYDQTFDGVIEFIFMKN
jgi:hypothetical protein